MPCPLQTLTTVQFFDIGQMVLCPYCTVPDFPIMAKYLCQNHCTEKIKEPHDKGNSMFIAGTHAKRNGSPFHFFDSVSDSDGDFLLIEAAHQLPKWLNPETTQNRVRLATCVCYCASAQIRNHAVWTPFLYRGLHSACGSKFGSSNIV